MSLARLGCGLVACLLVLSAPAAEPVSPASLAEARSLTTEVGPRLAGTAGDGRAVAWAVHKRVAPDDLPLVRAMHAVIEPLGIDYPGTDAAPYLDLHLPTTARPAQWPA
jgi:hypothetical protein